MGNEIANTADALASARRVLETEIAGLRALSRELDAGFARAIDTLERATGRIVVTGIGKSGHVARKIAATLASTGTPAQYVHPAEASHGDLGMITADDAVVALSNSGETAELAAIVDYAKFRGVALVSITARADSTMAKAADVPLIIPDGPEACPMKLAPTTSTTVMLALGDAIAVSLFERRGFSPQDFRALHPGGQLGLRLIPVRDIMHSGEELPLVPLEADMTEAVIEMSGKRFGCVGVVDSKCLVGIITDGDLRRHIRKDIFAMMAADVMTENPKTADEDALAAQVFGMMNDNKITNAFVVRNGVPIGIVHIHDILRAGIS